MSADNQCVHCGSDCGKTPVVVDSRLFCCNGCSLVYGILNENRLTQYYSLEKTPGIKLEDLSYDSKYAFLDKEEVKSRLYEFSEGPIAKITLYIPVIHCISCIWLLEHLSKLNPGIIHSAVNFITKKVTITFNAEEITLRQLVELLVAIHYIPDISRQTLEKKPEAPSNRTLLYKIGVAGFVFGNVMLYSLPEYLNHKPLGESLGTFLYFMSYALLIPLVFYSGSDYLISAWQSLKRGIININLPIALGIITLFTVTTYDVFTLQGPGYSDSLAGFLFFLLLGRWYQSKSYQALAFDRDYKSYFPVAVSKMTDNMEQSTLLEEIMVGDELLIRNKELIPADSILISGTALIDYSFVTGESTTIRKNKGEFIYAGGRQTGGAITVKVEKTVKQSHLTQLWNQEEEKVNTSKSIVNLTDRLSVSFTIIILVLALLGFGWWMWHGDLSTAMKVFTSVLIVACPCALSMSLPFTLGSAMRIFGKKGIYLKNTTVIEKLVRIDTIVFDKTGTITKPDANKIQFIGEQLSGTELCCVYSLARQSTHPLSNAIARHYQSLESVATEGFVEIPGRGIFGKVNQVSYKMGSMEYVTGVTQEVARQSSRVYLSVNNEVKGYFSIENQYREGFDTLMEDLKGHFDIYLLSGDNDSEREKLGHYFDADKMFFNQQAQEKMAFIGALQKQGKNVLMTGDGLNDAGAFLQSEVALSIADDIYHFSPAGDAIVEAAKLGHLYRFIRFARQSMGIVRLSFAISFLYNIVGLSYALSGQLSPVVAAILMPVSSVSVVAFATFATAWRAKKSL
ncbi:MAG TPA: heavy metal translocating P-type ATPase metal-binding domain-containing protein [Prolixibacteraceae bacterium]|nr:heavy metal translocating P-type ATPase metal-binding domain-containing protein [Prolixibacteraceae bacterium]